MTPVYVASSPDLDGVSGTCFLRCRTTRTKHITYDIDFAARLAAAPVPVTRVRVMMMVSFIMANPC